jgi:hypothetical protein
MHRLAFFVAGLLLIAAVCMPVAARADSYPAEVGRVVLWGGPFAKTDPEACDLYSAGNGGGWRYEAYPGPNCPVPTPGLTGWCFKPAMVCHMFDVARRCPYGGTLGDDHACYNPPSCPLLQVRDPETGECGLSKKKKNDGKRCDVTRNRYSGVSMLSLAASFLTLRVDQTPILSLRV